MNATRPEAETEYSTRPPGRFGPSRGLWAASGLALAAALALLVAELLPVLRVETIAAHPLLVSTVRTGPHDGWSLLLIGGLALLLVLLAHADRGRSRAAFAGVGALGLAALAIALLVDRSGIHANGAVTVAGVLRPATIRAGIGLYVETLGALLLLLAAGAGLLL